MDIVLIDIETTGLDPRAEGAAILEIAAARLWAALEARVTAQGGVAAWGEIPAAAELGAGLEMGEGR